jgi:hypothetical protein
LSHAPQSRVLVLEGYLLLCIMSIFQETVHN